LSLTPGTRIGVHQIAAQIGVGGMGEVYRATDTNLKRQVAIKVLPASVAGDADRLARFQREAEVLAALNHPNVAAIYGLEKTPDFTALVMELVEGEDLSQRIARGAIPIDEALPIARQIADALEAAHERGIIHRDLKPANIKVRADGTVKVLDFGLAKAMEPAAGSSPNMSMSPTLTTPAMTQAGIILGTAAYMSPEQARGRAADRRADIWAFGAVLFEMLTGTRAFGGDDISDTLANVLKVDPDWQRLPADVPARVRQVIRACLQKNPKQRIGDVQDARLALEGAFETAVPQTTVPPGVAEPRSTVARALTWTLAVSTLGLGTVLIMLWAPSRTRPSEQPVRLQAGLGADVSLLTDQGAAVVLSPDGRLLAFAAQASGSTDSQLFVRRLNQLPAVALAGTEGARNPFFSPDGQWVAFFAGGKLKKIATTGGAAVTLCDAPNGRGGSWADDDTIVFSPNSVRAVTLLRVPSAGGKPEPASKLALDETTHRWPQVIGGGKAVLYSAARTLTAWEEAKLVVQPLPTGAPKIVLQGGYYGRYLPSGHLVYMHAGTMFAVPFDLTRLEVTGQAVPVLENVTASPAVTGGAQFAVSPGGTLVYVSGQPVETEAPVVWMNREGKTTPLRTKAANWANPAFAPDGRQLAMYINDGTQSDIWIYDVMRDALSRFTFEPSDESFATWTADGRRIAFASNRADKSASNLYWQRADGTGEVQRLTESTNVQIPTSWRPSGKFLAFFEVNPKTRNDLMILPMEGNEAAGWKPGKPTVFLSTPFSEAFPIFSPDGRWLAYTSGESGRNEVYVRPFPGPGGKWQISADGGGLARWSRVRNEVFFQAPDNRLMVASYKVEGDAFRADKPRVWSERPFFPRSLGWDFDLHPDGERVAVAPVVEGRVAPKQDKAVFVFNFLDELRRLAPAKP
jgi:serine/threonine-protein kinase